MSEAGLVDFAALDTGAAGAEVEASAVDNTNTGVETPEPGAESSEHSSEVDGAAEGTEQTSETKEASATTGAAKAGATVAEPKAISEALKALKADPNNAGAAKVLRDAYFGEQAFKKEFKSVQEARNTKAFISEVAGADGPVTLEQARESYATTQAVLQNIEETDGLVRAGDPKIWDNIIEDLKSEGKTDAVPKLVASGLDKLRDLDGNRYYEVTKPHVLSAMEEAEFPKALNVAWQKLNEGDVAGAKRVLQSVGNWFKGLKDEVSQAKAAQSEENKLATERQKWESEKAQVESKTFKEGTAKEADAYSNRALGSELKDYLKMPFFKGFPRESLISMGVEIKNNLYAALENDKPYQEYMRAAWKRKTPDKERILNFHKQTLDRISREIVDRTIQTRYPGYAKGGSAAGRVAAAAAKKAADSKASATSVATGKPVYIATKPRDLVRTAITVGGKEYSPADLTMMEVTGKGFVKASNGQVRLITWRR